MNLGDLKITVKQGIAVAAVVFSAGGAAVTLDHLSDQVFELKTAVGKLTTSVDKLREKQNEMKIEQARINLIVNWLYGEGFKEGWRPTKLDTDIWEKELEDLRKAK